MTQTRLGGFVAFGLQIRYIVIVTMREGFWPDVLTGTSRLSVSNQSIPDVA